MNPEHLELLVTRVMPYGKYKGRLIADLPGHYLNWFASQGFPPGEIGRLLALMHEIDHNGLSSLIEPLRKRQRRGPRCNARTQIRLNSRARDLSDSLVRTYGDGR